MSAYFISVFVGSVKTCVSKERKPHLLSKWIILNLLLNVLLLDNDSEL